MLELTFLDGLDVERFQALQKQILFDFLDFVLLIFLLLL